MNFKKHTASIIGLAFLSALPFSAFAQVSFQSIFSDLITNVFRLLLATAVTIVPLFFFWGLAKFIFQAGNEQAVAAGKQLMFWGVIALFVLVSFLGIIAFIQGEFGLTNLGAPDYFPPAPI